MYDIFLCGFKFDMYLFMFYGLVGKVVMYNGVFFYIIFVGGGFFIFVMWDFYIGNLNLDINLIWFLNCIYDMFVEMDFL